MGAWSGLGGAFNKVGVFKRWGNHTGGEWVALCDACRWRETFDSREALQIAANQHNAFMHGCTMTSDAASTFIGESTADIQS